MCVGIPLQIRSCTGLAATASDGSRRETLDMSLVGPQPAGTWVLSFLGAAREVISDDEARLIAEALAGLERVMAGGDLGDAFADLDGRTPSLPPHLAAAHAAGLSEA
ncbi:MAG: HypC/HybG/HupF family hydrogenase formation chaperone [Pseudomonadota bacterium]